MKKKRTRLIGAAGALTVVGVLAVSSITRDEGLRTVAYRDVIGVWTICVGDTKNVKRGDRDTVEGCKARLLKRLPDYEIPMRACLASPDTIPGKTYVSFLSLAYNIGVGGFCKSSVVRAANAGNLYQACNNLLKFNKAGGRTISGLVSRRKRERALCVDGLDEPVTLYPDEPAQGQTP